MQCSELYYFFYSFFNPVYYWGNHLRYCWPLPSLCSCKGHPSVIARNPKMGSFLKMEFFSVSEKTLVCYKRDVKPCINKQITFRVELRRRRVNFEEIENPNGKNSICLFVYTRFYLPFITS